MMKSETIKIGETPKKLEWIEQLRAISIIAVVSIHTIYSALLLYGNDSLSDIGLATYYGAMNLLWWGVPCFLMITGYLLLDPQKEISYAKIFKQYISRILAVLFTFGVAFAYMELFFEEKTFKFNQVGQAILNVFQGKSWAHLWYIYCLIGIYLLLPIYKILAKHMKNLDLKYYLAVCLIFLSLAPLTKMIGIECGFYIHVSTIYPFWIFAGLAERKGTIGIRHRGLVLAVSSIFMICLTAIKYVCNMDIFSHFFGYDSIFVVIQAIALFEIIERSDIKGTIATLLDKLGTASFGIYIVHMFFVNCFYKLMKINPFENGGGYTLAALVLINLILSYIATVILKKLPGIRKII